MTEAAEGDGGAVEWRDMSKMSRDEAQSYVVEHCAELVGRVRQLKTDTESYAENNGEELAFDFDEFLEELEATMPGISEVINQVK